MARLPGWLGFDSLVLSDIPLLELVVILVKPINPFLSLIAHLVPPLLILLIPPLDLLSLLRAPGFDGFSILLGRW